MFDKFNLGLLDLLTLILPGGLLIGLAWKSGLISDWQFFDNPNLPEWVFGAVFAAAAYVMGHFVYLISSYLDDLVFAKIKEIWWPKNTLFTQANVEQLSNRFYDSDGPLKTSLVMLTGKPIPSN